MAPRAATGDGYRKWQTIAGEGRMADQAFKYQEKVLGDGSAVILNENGVIEAYDAAGNPTRTLAPTDPEWKAEASAFDLTPQ